VAVFLVTATLLPFGWSVRNWNLSGPFHAEPVFPVRASRGTARR
jgi:hypothetical protein